ncbi:MAG: oligosaccharide flippase family protein [Flavitalea sp.]
MKLPLTSFWLNSLFYTLLQRFSLFFFGVVSYMILVRGFSTSTNGVWALYITLFSLFEAIKQGLLRNATIKFLGLSRYAQQKKEVQSASLLIHVVFSIFIIALIFLFGSILASLLKSKELEPLLWRSAIMIILLIVYNHCEIILQANYRFAALFRAAFIRQLIFFAGTVILYFSFRNYFTLVNVLFLQILALIAGCLYIYRQSSQEVHWSYSHNAAIIREMFHFGKYTFGTNLFSGLSRSFDHFITAGALDIREGKNYVAYYNTVARINNMVDVPSLAAADVLYPKNVEALETQGIEKVKYYFEQMVATILALIIPISIFIFIFPRLIIFVIAGVDYYPAVSILQITILFSIVRPLSYQFGSTLDAIGKPNINFWANGALMMLNLIMTYAALKWFGGIGAAYAIAAYYSLSFIAMILILKKYIRLELKNIFHFCIRKYSDLFLFLINKSGKRK